MKAHKCDRCGKYVDGDFIPEIRGWGSDETPRISMELCPKCFDALQQFLLSDEGEMSNGNNTGND